MMKKKKKKKKKKNGQSNESLLFDFETTNSVRKLGKKGASSCCCCCCCCCCISLAFLSVLHLLLLSHSSVSVSFFDVAALVYFVFCVRNRFVFVDDSVGVVNDDHQRRCRRWVMAPFSNEIELLGKTQ